ncbi:MAG: Crp/Fnr family transcriptional regulator, partial [Acidimicrobiia bacterium]|nr:Crp/Fnr family transcriptional regulator [Acidimicrobiia bacterium]
APLLGGLRDEDVDRLAQASRLARYAVDEPLLDSRSPTRDVLLLTAGLARLVVLGGDGQEITIGDLGEGEIIDLATSAPRGGQAIAVRAVTDCEVLIIDADVVGEVGSRNAVLADGFNRVASIRRRRIERVTDREPITEPRVDSTGRVTAAAAGNEPVQDGGP